MNGDEDRFLDLAGRFLEGIAGDAELEELDRIVRADAGARQTLADLVDQHGTLRRLHARPVAAAARPRPAAVPARAGRPGFRPRLAAGIAAAAAAVLLVAIAAVLLLRGGEPKATPPTLPPPTTAKSAPKAPPPAPTPAPEAVVRAPDGTPPDRPPAPPAAGTPAVPPAPEPARPPAAPQDAPVAAAAPETPPAPESPDEPPMVISLFGGNEPPAAAETPPPAAPTAAGIALARLERVEGSVFLFAAGAPGRTEASAGRDILRGQGLATGKGSLAVVKYPDGTRLEVAEETTLDLFARWSPRRAASPAEGKYLLLRQGMLAAEVAAQPKDAPMILGTPLADVQVLGTRFTLAAAPESTRVEVKEGRVALVRRADRAAVEVRAGQCAEAAPGAPLAAKAVLPPIASTVTVRFGPPGTAVPAGALLDSGDEFDAKRGYGWQGSKERRRSQVNVFRDHQWVTKGREPRAFARAADPTRASGVSAGSAFHAETWTMNLANGRYLVTVCAGDADAAQGPHHVTVEGQAVVVASPTAAGEYVEKQDVPVAVKDGRLTVAVGGHRSALVPNRERPGETTLVSLVIKKIAE